MRKRKSRAAITKKKGNKSSVQENWRRSQWGKKEKREILILVVREFTIQFFSLTFLLQTRETFAPFPRSLCVYSLVLRLWFRSFFFLPLIFSSGFLSFLDVSSVLAGVSGDCRASHTKTTFVSCEKDDRWEKKQTNQLTQIALRNELMNGEKIGSKFLLSSGLLTLPSFHLAHFSS